MKASCLFLLFSVAVPAQLFSVAVPAQLFSVAVPAQQTPPAFKAETNLVLVPVVVRDAKGEAVANLTKADFKLFDNGKEQPITSFQVEETSGQLARDRSAPDPSAAPANGGAPAAPPKAEAMVIPEHFVALLFDDQPGDSRPVAARS
jgi:VWFA-related protein